MIKYNKILENITNKGAGLIRYENIVKIIAKLKEVLDFMIKIAMIEIFASATLAAKYKHKENIKLLR
ncbi:hypothetical protein [Clostridium beijerinckii]|uniref:Uncharacterized protein n=1 Tax=Clostridium beijerinckii TaxID=1520 RepID=A0A1S8S233_CLOBE|nr:hypothetical protein [Clostridium beijerinckii]NRY63734.1 hypothetical protein [Clostridium beijerinckii]OOM59507.1 hypothetical protein CLBCK_34570 [Clostridium beijerinckii]